MKEQNKAPEKEFNKIKKNNIPDAEFKTLVIRMLKELKGRVDELSENFYKEMENITMEIENIIGIQSEIKNKISEMKRE